MESSNNNQDNGESTIPSISDAVLNTLNQLSAQMGNLSDRIRNLENPGKSFDYHAVSAMYFSEPFFMNFCVWYFQPRFYLF